MYRPVANELSKTARKLLSDPFGRSVFNRSYYSIFLAARNLVLLIDTDRTSIEHASLPEFLRGKISRRVRDEYARQMKAKIGPSKAIEAMVLENLEELAKLLDDARRLRTIADYEPSQKVSFEGGSVTLGMKKDTEAIHWADKAESLCGKIEDGLRQFSIIQRV
jgi:hypothetical protein